MSESSKNTLSEEIKTTERIVTNIAELNSGASLQFGDLPEPPPPIQGPQQQNTQTDCEEESSTDEIQDVWLASLNGRVRLLEANAKAAIQHAEADGTLTDNALRKEMADKTFSFMERWCCFVALILFIYLAKHDGDPPKEIILALLGTCTVSIIGLVGFVVSGLFKSKSK
ncbi:hypothetical protein [Pectobacterium aquaticum]|uniref:DUF2335 domain-containing protein n=1 Tax=Pectobacterium aquaticum TaxID=2204145 RepID=A0AA93AK66_9GAMM|nr:hypothetical protein [Pectobacterium aquaticum]RRO12249.1 hypothetical protein DMB84_019565 [Pectobacterium aquaticum]